MKTLSITVDDYLVKDLDQSIRENALSGRSEAIREAIKYWLARRMLRKKIQKEIEGYKKKPVKNEEFEIFNKTQEWPE
ncbi:MAG: ribbon-helix-helix protein, CopG family [Deltaproteobacteria bacterium]|nr:ribbon-helix-helix protein, CopG family [Deltaproteobacteria bacterium]